MIVWVVLIYCFDLYLYQLDVTLPLRMEARRYT